MRTNAKAIASLVRKAKKKLHQGKREEALELMKKAVVIDDNTGVLIQIVQLIGSRKTQLDPVEEPPDFPAEIPEEPDQKFEMTDLEIPYEDTSIPEPADKVVENNQERKAAMALDDQLDKLFEASDMEYNRGNQQKAIAYLKRAMKLDPDNSDIQNRIDTLKTKIKATNMVQIARKKLETGKVSETVEFARKVFELMPETPGLDELLSDIERVSSDPSPSSTTSVSNTRGVTSSEEYIEQIRQLVRDNFLEKAASLASRAFSIHPHNELLAEFLDNFIKLGLIEQD